MHARHVTLRPREEESFERIAHVLLQVILPATQRQQGFTGAMVMTDREASKMITLTMWNSEAEMLAGEENEYLQDQISRVIGLLRGPPIIEHYQIDIMS